MYDHRALSLLRDPRQFSAGFTWFEWLPQAAVKVTLAYQVMYPSACLDQSYRDPYESPPHAGHNLALSKKEVSAQTSFTD